MKNRKYIFVNDKYWNLMNTSKIITVIKISDRNWTGLLSGKEHACDWKETVLMINLCEFYWKLVIECSISRERMDGLVSGFLSRGRKEMRYEKAKWEIIYQNFTGA